jgi:hypothetical protein
MDFYFIGKEQTMEWNSIDSAPTNKRIFLLCEAYKEGGYAIFEAMLEGDCFFVPCPQSREENWIELFWTPLFWSQKSSVSPPWAKK